MAGLYELWRDPAKDNDDPTRLVVGLLNGGLDHYPLNLSPGHCSYAIHLPVCALDIVHEGELGVREPASEGILLRRISGSDLSHRPPGSWHCAPDGLPSRSALRRAN